MAFDVSVRQTPEMKKQGKPPGENLAGILLNPPGLPPRVCVVVITEVDSLQGPPSLQKSGSRRLSGSKRLSGRGLNASGSLLERVRWRAHAVVSELGPDAPETMRAQFRLAVVLLESGHYKEALGVLTEELKRRRAILGKEHIDSFRAMRRFGQILTNLGHFRDAQEPWLMHGFANPVPRNWSLRSSATFRERTLTHSSSENGFEVLLLWAPSSLCSTRCDMPSLFSWRPIPAVELLWDPPTSTR